MCWKFVPCVKVVEPLRDGAKWKIINSWALYSHQWINGLERVGQVSLDEIRSLENGLL
jgi:hypothetical protein